MSDDEVRKRTGRARRRLAVGGAVAAVAVLCLAVALVRLGGDEPERKFTTGPKAPATSRALVAVALTHIDVEPTYFESLRRPDLDYGKGTLGGIIQDGREDNWPDSLVVAATPEGRSPRCGDALKCDVTQTGQGELTIGWVLESPEEDPGFVIVHLEREDEMVQVQYSGPAIHGDPRKQDLKISVTDMVAIVEDPAFSLTTRQAAVDAGEKLKPWKGEKPSSPPPAPDGEPWTLRALAVVAKDEMWVPDEFGESEFVEPSGPTGKGRGIWFRSGKTTYDVLIVEDPELPEAIACPVGWECFDGDGATYAWKGNDGAILRDRGDFVVRAWVTDNSSRIDKLEFYEDSLARLDALTADERTSPLMSPELIKQGEQFDAWKDR